MRFNLALGGIIIFLLSVVYGENSIEIKNSKEFADIVEKNSRATLVEFYSGMCGYCNEFKPTWDKLIAQATRLQTARVNIDKEHGMKIAQRLGVLDLGIPAVLLFNQQQDNVSNIQKYDTLMAGDIYPLSRLIKRIYHKTRGQHLALDDEGFFLKGGRGTFLTTNALSSITGAD